METEREMAETHLSHFGLDTIFFFTRPELAAISSHLVRELAHFGEDTGRYLPRLPLPDVRHQSQTKVGQLSFWYL